MICWNYQDLFLSYYDLTAFVVKLDVIVTDNLLKGRGGGKEIIYFTNCHCMFEGGY